MNRKKKLLLTSATAFALVMGMQSTDCYTNIINAEISENINELTAIEKDVIKEYDRLKEVVNFEDIDNLILNLESFNNFAKMYRDIPETGDYSEYFMNNYNEMVSSFIDEYDNKIYEFESQNFSDFEILYNEDFSYYNKIESKKKDKVYKLYQLILSTDSKLKDIVEKYPNFESLKLSFDHIDKYNNFFRKIETYTILEQNRLLKYWDESTELAWRTEYPDNFEEDSFYEPNALKYEKDIIRLNKEFKSLTKEQQNLILSMGDNALETLDDNLNIALRYYFIKYVNELPKNINIGSKSKVQYVKSLYDKMEKWAKDDIESEVKTKYEKALLAINRIESELQKKNNLPANKTIKKCNKTTYQKLVNKKYVTTKTIVKKGATTTTTAYKLISGKNKTTNVTTKTKYKKKTVTTYQNKITYYKNAKVKQNIKLYKDKKTNKYTKKDKVKYRSNNKKQQQITLKYAKGKVVSRIETVFNKKGEKKTNKNGKAYQYKTTYKKGKAKKTTRYQFNKKAKLTKAKKVKIRKAF